MHTSRNEILALVGVSSKVLNDKDEPVHILFDRVNGLTSEAFVEFVTIHEAEKAMTKLSSARAPRLCGAPVDCRLADEETLMTALFPTAKGCVDWKDGTPTPLKTVDGSNSNCPAFEGLIGLEEMETIAKHAENVIVSPTSHLPYLSHGC